MATTRKRAYRSTLRSEQAAATRARVVDAAIVLFGERGYAGTTMQAIADAAGVSVETAQLNGPKAQLLLAAMERAAAGEEGQEPLFDRELGQAAANDPDPGRAIQRSCELVVWSHARTAALWRAYEHAALHDPAVAESHAALIGRMHGDWQRIVAFLDDRGMVGPNVDREELASTLWLLMLPDAYTRLVVQAGWSEQRFVAWLRDRLERELAG